MARSTITSWRRPIALATIGSLTALLAVACSTDLTDPGDPDFSRVAVGSVTVSPNPISGMVGQGAQFTATVKSTAGQTITRTVTWTSSDTTIVQVNATGYATAVGAGTARVIASTGGKSGYASATVTPIPVATVTVTPGSASGAVGDSGQFTAALADANGNPLTGRTITWSSSNTSVATVTATGMAHAVAGGTANIIATSEGQSGQATVTVSGPAAPAVGAVTVTPGSASGAVGDSGQFTATVTDPSGAVMTGQTVTWASSDTTVVTVNATGLAKARGAGSASLSATAGGKTGTAAITVTGGTQPPPPPPPQPGSPASISLNPASASITVGQTQVILATVTDSAGNTLSSPSITWTSSNPSVASVVGGLVTGLLGGNATISATSGSASASTGVSVTSVVNQPTTGWPNAPSNLSLISDQPFDDPNALGWSLIWNTNGYGTTINDPNAPFSPSGVLQLMYPAGFQSGSAPATVGHAVPNARHFYSGMWWKPSSPWQGDASNVNKIQFLFLDGSAGDIYMAMYGPPGGPYLIRICSQLTQFPSQGWFVPNVNSTPVTLGQWHRLEWLLDYDAKEIKWWMDGQLQGDYTNVQFPAETIVDYKVSPTWGGIGDTKQETDYYWYDHVIIKGN